VPNVPRKSFIAREDVTTKDVTTIVAAVAGILTYIRATSSATAAVAWRWLLSPLWWAED
jgi:hypothetical protein